MTTSSNFIRIKAKLCGLNSYSTEDTMNKRVVLPISVKQPYHENGKFKATIELINKRFSYCDILVADTLQRHNLACNKKYSTAELHEISKNEGDNWIARNKKYLNLLSMPHKIIRWDECLAWPTFSKVLDKIKEHYLNDLEYHAAFQRDIQIFIERYQRHNPNNNIKIIEDNCLTYLFEENAVFLSYFLDNSYNFILYPSKIPKSVSMSRDIFIKDKIDLIQDLKIYFKSCQSSNNLASAYASDEGV